MKQLKKFLFLVIPNLVAILIILSYPKFKDKHKEYSSLVDSVVSLKTLPECKVDLAIEREWFFPEWNGAKSMDIKLQMDNLITSTKTSRYDELPEKISNTGGGYTYHFQWSERSSGNISSSYADISFNAKQEVESLKVVECKPMPESIFWEFFRTNEG